MEASSSLNGLSREELIDIITQAMIRVLNSPIPEVTVVGSIYDVLRDLDVTLADE